MSAVVESVKKGAEAPKRAKRMSYFQCLANAANSRRSTGPRTDQGKLRSSQNALKHGFRATAVYLDEDPGAVEDAHELFVKSFGPRNAAAKAAVDLAFRAKRRLERMYAAEDARISFIQDFFENEIRRDRRKFLARAQTDFDVDPPKGVAALLSTDLGTEFLLSVLDDFDRDVRNSVWSPTHTAKLLAMEENGEIADTQLDTFNRWVDAVAEAHETLAEVDPGDRLLRYRRVQAEEHLKGSEEIFAQAKPKIAARIAELRRRIEESRCEAHVREVRDLRRLMDDRKVDDSPESVLFERYKSQALREFHRAVELALKLCGGKPGAIQTPLSTRDLTFDAIVRHANRVVEEKWGPWAPNEPMSGHAQNSDDPDREGPSTGVRGGSGR